MKWNELKWALIPAFFIRIFWSYPTTKKKGHHFSFPFQACIFEVISIKYAYFWENKPKPLRENSKYVVLLQIINIISWKIPKFCYYGILELPTLFFGVTQKFWSYPNKGGVTH